MPNDTDAGNDRRESIVVDGITKQYGDFTALRDVSFSVQPGEIVGFLGPNGAGKTTTMKILTSFMAATEGTAEVAGHDVHEAHDKVRERTGYLPENVPLYEEMLVYDYLKFVAEVRGVEGARHEERIEQVVGLTGLEDVIHREIFELSKGYRQRVGLAQAIIHQPEVIILDEPTTGLDPNQIVDIRDVITGMAEDRTIILSTHILQEVSAVCDRIIIINEGEIVADDTLAELQAAVESTDTGLQVEFQPTDRAGEVEEMLAGLNSVDEVIRPGGRGRDELMFELETSDEQATRRDLLEREASSDFGLVRLSRAEPTLEDIFRVYTEGATQEGRKSA
jgi:ABC-2 type transport system ATP-binding protein